MNRPVKSPDEQGARRSRSRFIPRVIGLALLFFLPTLGTGAAFATATPHKTGGTLNIVGVGNTWASTDPIYGSAIQSAAEPYNLAYQTLFNYNTTTRIVEPQLALNFSYNATHTTMTINLRHGVNFQDGTPMNAQAVVYNLERTSASNSGSACVPFFTNVVSIVASGTYQVQINFNPLYSALPYVLGSDPCTFIASPTAIQSEGANFPSEPVGTSPYKLVPGTMDFGVSVSFSRWTGAWQKASINTVNFTDLGDDQSAIEAVQANTANVFDASSPQDIPLAKQSKLSFVQSAPISEGYLRLNMTSAPFNNIVARRAFAAALDLPLITKTIFGKYAIPDESLLTPASFAFAGERVLGFPQYNPTVAASDVASLPGGKLTFTLTSGTTPYQEQTAQALAAELSAVPGINVTLAAVTQTVLLNDQHGKLYQALFAVGNSSTPDPDNNYYRALYSTSSNNQEGFVNTQFDNLVTQARETFSTPQRKALYLQAQKIVATYLPIVPIYAYPLDWIYNKHVHGLQAYDTGTLDLSGVTVS